MREKRAEKLRQQGLVIHAASGKFTLQPELVLASEITSPFDLIILTVKSYALEQAIRDITPAVGEHTLILPRHHADTGICHHALAGSPLPAQITAAGTCVM